MSIRTETKLGIAIFGAGRIGRIHAANLHQHPNAEILHVVDIVTQAASDLAVACGAVVSSIEEALSDPAVVAVVIATSTDTHCELIAASAREGKAIFCEKPLDLDVQTARKSLEIATAHNVLLCMGFNRRHDPSFDKLRQEVRKGSVGTVEVVSITSRDPAPPPLDYIGHSGGLFRDMMIHDFDMARWLLDEDVVEVFATGSVLIDQDIGRAGDIDTAVVILKTASGSMCHITNSRRCSYGYDQRVEVFGSAGMVRVGNQTESLVEIANGEGVQSDPALHFFLERYADAYRLQLDKFLCAVEGDDMDIPQGIDGLRALVLADAAQQSYETGQPVQLT